MTAAELESMCQCARDDDAYRLVVHDGYLVRLSKTLDLLRAKGVTRAKVPVASADGMWILAEFDIVPLAQSDGSPPIPADLDEADKCACGCLKDAEHNAQGLCIGKCCPVSVCNPEMAKEVAK